jgi:hypothetical protein
VVSTIQKTGCSSLRTSRRLSIRTSGVKRSSGPACVDSGVADCARRIRKAKLNTRNAARLTKETLAKLHEWAFARVKELPESARVLITSHDAFNYFGRAYGFQVSACRASRPHGGRARGCLQGRRIHQAEEGEGDLRREQCAAGDDRADQHRRGAKIGGELFSDAMGTPGTKVTVNGETLRRGHLHRHVEAQHQHDRWML